MSQIKSNLIVLIIAQQDGMEGKMYVGYVTFGPGRSIMEQIGFILLFKTIQGLKG